MCVGMTDKRRTTGTKSPESALPLGAIAAGKRVRWYFVHCPEGKERAFCKNILRVVSREVLRDAFVPRKECEVQEASGWRRLVVTVYPSYFVVVTDDPVALQHALVQHTFPLYIVGKIGSGYASVAEEAQNFFVRVMDSAHIIRFSAVTFSCLGNAHVLTFALWAFPNMHFSCQCLLHITRGVSCEPVVC